MADTLSENRFAAGRLGLIFTFLIALKRRRSFPRDRLSDIGRSGTTGAAPSRSSAQKYCWLRGAPSSQDPRCSWFPNPF